MNICSIIKEAAADCPQQTAVVEEDKQLTYGQLWDEVKRLSRGLKEIGIKENDTVALILPTSKDFLISFFSLMKINAVAVPLEPVFTTREYREMFKECRPKAVITSSYIILKILGYDEYLISGRKIITSDADPWIKKKYSNSFSFRELQKEQGCDELGRGGENLASINYTYRGYGYPVGAMLTHNNYYHGVRTLDKFALEAESFLNILPMAHIFSLIAGTVAPLSRRAKIVILRSHSAREIFRVIKRHSINCMIGVPTLYVYLMKTFRKDKYDISSVKYPISGGSFMSAKMQAEVKNIMGLNIMQGYGLTEALIVSCNASGANRPSSLGQLGKDIKVKISAAEKGKKRGNSETGEILIKGPTVMKGFYGREKETQEVLNDGWLHTGDRGHMDGDGYLYFDGLKKKIAKVGGESVDLLEIEQVLLSHPCVRDVELTVANDILWGQKIKAGLALGKDLTKDEILSFCRGKLAAYKIPKVIKIT